MTALTPLERFFIEEFCRFRGVASHDVDQLRVTERHRNPVGFMTDIDPATVPPELHWGVRVFSTPRISLVGPRHEWCGSLIFFDEDTGVLAAVEGYTCEEAWPEPEAPFFWSETRRITRYGRDH